jgi:hypothetical protein
VILTFHKVEASPRTKWSVSWDKFEEIIRSLSSFDVVGLDDYDPTNPKHVVITFDGVYKCILEHAAPLLYQMGFRFECFIIGDYVGKDNSFDKGEPLFDFASFSDLAALINWGGTLQWHTRTHQIPKDASPQLLLREYTVPTEFRNAFPSPHFKHVAYPHGISGEGEKELVKTMFISASSVDDGDVKDRYNLPRTTVFEETKLPQPTVGIILANHNYGNYLKESIRSVLQQTRKPDVFLISDDASVDNSREIIESFWAEAETNINPKNLGIVDHFNSSVEKVPADYLMFLGADNYLHPQAIDLLSDVLNKNPDCDVVYFDMVIFGPLATDLANKVGAREIGWSKRDNLPVFLWEFPDFSETVSKELPSKNVINGSAMFRRRAFYEAGGYKPIYPEDHNLWTRILSKPGSTAIRVPRPLLYYRQHSNSQANNALGTQRELLDTTRQLDETRQQLDETRQQLEHIVVPKNYLRFLISRESGGRYLRATKVICKAFLFLARELARFLFKRLKKR